MAFVPIAKTAKIEIKAHRATDTRVNVLHIRLNTYPPGAGDLDAIADSAHTWVTDHYAPVVAQEVQFDELIVTDVGQPNGAQASRALTGLRGGLSTGVGLPGNCTCVTTFHTSLGGRSGRGRFFAFEATAHEVDTTEVFTPVYVGLMTAAMNALLSAFPFTGSYQLAVGSRHLQVSNDVTSATTHNYIGNQKDRLPGHRRHKVRRLP